MFQPELFDDLQTDQKPNKLPLSPFSGRFLHLRVPYEDAIFTVLALVLVLLGGFCLGVERGKAIGPQPAVVATAGIAAAGENSPAPEGLRIKEIRTAAPSAAPAQRKALPVIPAVATTAPQAASAPAQAAPTPAVSGGEFGIQLATYVGPESAQQEARKLEKMGVRAQVVKQGKYLELRAVGYQSKAEAKTALAVLRKKYPDAFLKRVSN